MNIPNDLDIFPDEILDKMLYESFWPGKGYWLTMLQRRILLSSINRRCMKIVQGNTHFWNLISIFRSTPAECIERWLVRSASADLTLRIHGGYCDETREQEGEDTPIVLADFAEFQTLLLPTIQHAMGRVRGLHISASTHDETLRTVDMLVRFGVARLRELKLHNWEHRGTGTVLVQMRGMDDLDALVLEGMEPFSLGQSAFGKITTLRLGHVHEPSLRPNATHTLHALAAAASVVVLHLDDVTDHQWNGGRVPMPSVEDFWMVCSDQQALAIAAALDLPNVVRWRAELQGDVRLTQIQAACSSQFRLASAIELSMDHASDQELANFYAAVTIARTLDFRFCASSMGGALLKSMATNTALARSLCLLRLSIHTQSHVLRKLLQVATRSGQRDGFILTTGLRNPRHEPDQRWFLAADELQNEDYAEDVGYARGRWVNADEEEYLTQTD